MSRTAHRRGLLVAGIAAATLAATAVAGASPSREAGAAAPAPSFQLRVGAVMSFTGALAGFGPSLDASARIAARRSTQRFAAWGCRGGCPSARRDRGRPDAGSAGGRGCDQARSDPEGERPHRDDPQRVDDRRRAVGDDPQQRRPDRTDVLVSGHRRSCRPQPRVARVDLGHVPEPGAHSRRVGAFRPAGSDQRRRAKRRLRRRAARPLRPGMACERRPDRRSRDVERRRAEPRQRGAAARPRQSGRLGHHRPRARVPAPRPIARTRGRLEAGPDVRHQLDEERRPAQAHRRARHRRPPRCLADRAERTRANRVRPHVQAPRAGQAAHGLRAHLLRRGHAVVPRRGEGPVGEPQRDQGEHARRLGAAGEALHVPPARGRDPRPRRGQGHRLRGRVRADRLRREGRPERRLHRALGLPGRRDPHRRDVPARRGRG